MRNVVDSCDKHQTGLIIIILITNVRQYLRRRWPDIDSVQGASCRPTHGPLYTSASIYRSMAYLHCQSVCPVPSPSLLTTRRNHQTLSSPPSTKTVAGVTAPRGQSTEIQSRCSLALCGIVKTDNRIYTGFLNSISGFGKNPLLTSLIRTSCQSL